jgi:hypothetical protein
MTIKYLKIIAVMVLLKISQPAIAQRFIEREGYVRFYSEAPLENIEAVNNSGLSVFNMETGDIAFTIPIKKFEFEKSLMKEHFNENYLESEKFPNGTFTGKITGFEINGDEQNLKAEGTMTIHGVSKEISVSGTGLLSNNSIILKSVFQVKLKDYNIKIPKVVLYNVAEEVEVTIEFKYTPYDK